ncbi:MAG: hypothetical protein RLZZ599_904 [Bacteroidota bacterium]|jgi:hypothetical protein
MKSKLLIAALLVGQLAFAQSATDLSTWFKAGTKFDLNKTHSLTFSGQYRTSNLETDRWITELQFGREINKNWDLGLEFRHYMLFDSKGATQGTFHRARLQFFASQHIDLPKGDLHIRYALQQRTVLTGSGNDKFTGRMRLQYEYPIKNFKWDPTFEAEVFASSAPNFDRALRLGIGSESKVAGKRLGFGYFYQRDISNTDMHAHVIQTSIRF